MFEFCHCVSRIFCEFKLARPDNVAKIVSGLCEEFALSLVVCLGMTSALYSNRRMRFTSSLRSLAEFENITISSRYARANSQHKEARMAFMALRKVAGAFFSPNGIFVNLYGPYCEANGDLSSWHSSASTCQYPELSSSAENTIASPKLAIHSFMRGSGTNDGLLQRSSFLVDEKVKRNIFLPGKHDNCSSFNSGRLDKRFGKYSIYLSRGKLPCYRSCPV